MDIACLEEDIKAGLTTHIEIKPTNMLSLIANLTPFSDFNQSPRYRKTCLRNASLAASNLSCFITEICINVKWVSKRWVPHVIRSPTEPVKQRHSVNGSNKHKSTNKQLREIDNKMYRIQTPQRPAVRTFAQDDFPMDDFPNGANAVVAVISYTGFDMEDAMIINKSSYERGLYKHYPKLIFTVLMCSLLGFGHGSLYKHEIIDMAEDKKSTLSVGAR